MYIYMYNYMHMYCTYSISKEYAWWSPSANPSESPSKAQGGGELETAPAKLEGPCGCSMSMKKIHWLGGLMGLNWTIINHHFCRVFMRLKHVLTIKDIDDIVDRSCLIGELVGTDASQFIGDCEPTHCKPLQPTI